jgi:hypothetical protein
MPGMVLQPAVIEFRVITVFLVEILRARFQDGPKVTLDAFRFLSAFLSLLRHGQISGCKELGWRTFSLAFYASR